MLADRNVGERIHALFRHKESDDMSGFDYRLDSARDDILAGGQIVAVMVPDETLAANYANPLPRYEECYPLSRVCLSGNQFWGLTDGEHMPYQFGKGISEALHFGYTNSAPLYFSAQRLAFQTALQSQRQQLTLCNLRQYSDFKFVVRPALETVWDSDAPTQFDALRQAIQQGLSFRLVFEDEGGLVFSLPVDLPMLFYDKGDLSITTKVSYVYDFCANPDSLIEAIRQIKPDFDTDPDPLSIKSRITSAIVPAYFNLFLDGSYVGVPEIFSGVKKTWKMAKLFSC
jgi:hypothetical protein